MNARSLKAIRRSRMSKLRDFEAILSNGTHDCVCVTETRLNSSVGDAELSVPGYTQYLKDRTNNKTRGGGLLCVIKDSVLSTRRADLEPDDEILVVDIRPDRIHKIAVLLCYRPPDGDIGTFVTNINSTLIKISTYYDHVIVLGDFNLPKVKGCHDSVLINISNAEQDFCDTFNNVFLTQLNLWTTVIIFWIWFLPPFLIVLPVLTCVFLMRVSSLIIGCLNLILILV